MTNNINDVIDVEFRNHISSHKGAVVIMAGSGSDEPHFLELEKELDKYGLPYMTRIASAHKQPEKVIRLIHEINTIPGSLAYIAVAGGTDALSGMVSYHSLNGVVISCPPDAHNESCYNNPPGSSNAYIPNPKNAARFIAQMFAGKNPLLRNKIGEGITQKNGELEKADYEFKNNREGGK
ncbi:AIR carboxylase family protein [Candidatus Woesearchaeota archaeon]|nr:AIR carboxylase family protein [Candidatus Woesearchaeota archaeon]